MSYTKSTVNLKLPQWEENDYPSWLTDVNQAFSNIDTNAGDQKASIETALSAASEARTLAVEASNNVTSLSGEVNSVKSDVSEVRGLATTASTTANSAMDIAEIAQDSAEQVANKTANIESNATKISHVVNGVTSGYTEYGQGFTSICSSNGTSKLDFDDSGNIVSRNNDNNIVFNSNNVLIRINALEQGGGGSEEIITTTLTPLQGSGTFTLTRYGKICVISGMKVTDIALSNPVCNLPVTSSHFCSSVSSGNNEAVYGRFYIDANSNVLRCNNNIHGFAYFSLMFIAI